MAEHLITQNRTQIQPPHPDDRVDEIIDMAADYFGVTRNDIMSERRDRFTICARHVSYALIVGLTDHSMRSSAELLRRVHPASSWAIRAVGKRPELLMAYDVLSAALTSNQGMRLAA